MLKAALLEQLQAGPGEAARQEVAVGASCPIPSRWTLRTIRASVAWLKPLSVSGVWWALHSLGVQLHSARAQRFSPDENYVAKLNRLKRILRKAARQPGQVVAVFLDEFGYVRWPEPAPTWTSAESVALAPRAGTNTQWRTIGCMNALTGQVDYLDNYIVGRRQVTCFYAQIDRAYPDAERIYIIQDNWNVHTHPDVLEALAAHPRLVPVGLPTYAPWLNPIEKLWRWLRQDVLKMHRWVGDWPLVRQHVRDFLDQFAHGSSALLRYVGLFGDGMLASVIRHA